MRTKTYGILLVACAAMSTCLTEARTAPDRKFASYPASKRATSGDAK